ncbi:hypothetical protein V8E36_005522 [Tilletia maclaganii]
MLQPRASAADAIGESRVAVSVSPATGGPAHRTFSDSSATSSRSPGSPFRPRQATYYSNTSGHQRTSVPGMAEPSLLAAPTTAPHVNKSAFAPTGVGPGHQGPKGEAPGEIARRQQSHTWSSTRIIIISPTGHAAPAAPRTHHEPLLQNTGSLPASTCIQQC